MTRSCTGQIIKGDILRKLYGCSSFALFSLFYGLHYVAAWLSREETLGEVAVDIVGSATLLIELLWLYQLNVDLGRYCGYRSVNTAGSDDADEFAGFSHVWRAPHSRY